MKTDRYAWASLAMALSGVLIVMIGDLYLNSLVDLSRHQVEVAGRPFRTSSLSLELFGVIVGWRAARYSRTGWAGLILSFLLLVTFLVLNRFDLLVFERRPQ